MSMRLVSGNRAYHWLLIDSDSKHLCSRFSHPRLDGYYKQGNVDYKTMGLPLSSPSTFHLHSILRSLQELSTLVSSNLDAFLRRDRSLTRHWRGYQLRRT